MKTFPRILFSAIAAIITIPTIYLVSVSRGKTRRHRDSKGNVEPGAVAQITHLDVNGILQGLIIRGRDVRKPVLLYLHGGPGAPEYPIAKQMNTGLEDLFIVCYWEQRGAGFSYNSKINPETMTMQSFVDDALKVTQYLRKRFARDKIYLLGHSWGSYVGAKMASLYPQYYEALISTGQITNQAMSESIAYAYLLEETDERNDRKAQNALKKIGPPPWYLADNGVEKILVQRKYVTKYGGTIKDKKTLTKVLLGPLICTEYTLTDKINYARGVKFSLNNLLDIIMKADLFSEIPTLSIPVYFLQGYSDYQTVYSLVKEYYEKLHAPVKELYTFYNSAHAPIFEEPDKFNTIMGRIVTEVEKQKLYSGSLQH